MSKNILQDVLPPERRSIRDIPIPTERRRRSVNDSIRPNFSAVRPPRVEVREDPEEEVFTSQKKPSRVAFFVSVIVSLSVLIFAFLSVFGDATVYVTPREEKVTLDATFKAKREDVEGALTYDVVTLSKKGEREVKATNGKQVDTKAKGKIVIYNGESSPQTLVKTTRFETPNGLIYRIPETVTVPAKVGTKLGSLETSVIADGIGSKYNIGLSDFTIPGFAGSAKFKTVYARSKTPMTEGGSGLEKTASQEDLAEARNEIEKTLRDELIAEVRSEIPEGYIFFETSSFIEFELLPNEPVSTDSIKVSEEARFHGVIFNKDSLVRAIAKKSISNYDNLPIEIGDIEKLTFSSDSSSGPIWEQDEITFNLKGGITITWLYDEIELKKLIVGKTKDQTKAILGGQAYFSQNIPVGVIVRPFWKSTLPKEANKIKIEKRNK